MATVKDLMAIGVPDEQAIRCGYEEVSVTTTANTQGAAGGQLTGRGNKVVQANIASAANSITLPSLAAIGDEILINNIANNAGLLFPHVGGSLNGETINVGSMVIGAQGNNGCCLRALRVSSIRWAVLSCIVT